MRATFTIKIFLLASVTIVSLSLITLYTTNLINEEEKIRVFNKFSNSVTLLANGASSELDSVIGIVEVTANRPVVRNVDYANLISETYKGIPEDMDLPKREVAKDILDKYPEFEFVSFNMPNGDFYMMEPHADQLNLARLNFADRDWYRGVMETKDTYVSEVYESTTLHRNIVAVRTPVYDDDNSLIGIWGGSLSLSFLENNVKNMILEKNVRILFYDQYGKIILDTKGDNTTNYDLPNKIFTDALSGNSKTLILNTPNVLVSYAPVKAAQVNWAVVVTQPYDDAFSMERMIWNGAIIIISSIIGVVGFSSYFFHKMSKANVLLTKQLQQTEINKEEFAAMITHELKTPLVPIIGYCKMLKTSMLGKLNEEEAAAIQVIERNAKALEGLISDIMDVHKLDLGKMKFSFENLPLSEFFDNLDSSYKKILKDRRIEFVIKLSTKDSVIHTDKSRLRQVFDNLINNSMKFVSENNGLIEVGGYKEKDSLILYVKDNGIGIPK
ncbi:MAG: sensor histidine kinase, partial [Nitrosopumilaceae archaeon]